MPSYKPGDTTKGVVQRVARTGLDLVDRGADWWQLPLPAQLLQLAHFREDLRRFNLYDTEAPRTGLAWPSPPSHRRTGPMTAPRPTPRSRRWVRPGRASGETSRSRPRSPKSRRAPSPREVSNKLLNRDSFKPATTLNVLAACWLQFQNHDWFSHGDNSETEFLQIPLAHDDEWGYLSIRDRRSAAAR
jgi:hypothetical protein